MEELILYFSLKYEGDFQCIYRALKSKERIDESLRLKLKKQLKCCYTTIVSDDYPEMLKTINMPPFVLFYYGDLSLVKGKTIGVVGMRDVSDYGTQSTRDFVKGLVKKGCVIVSGMARGVDTIAHTTAIENGGKTIAVLGTGIEFCYPKMNEKLYRELKSHHLIMSEYPFYVTPSRKLFPFRNRIVAGLSHCLLISEANKRSGTMITAGYALEQGKEVNCVPGRYYESQGCLDLIKQGAKLVVNVNDIIEDEDLG